jgi:hypothetical protein
VKISAPFFWGQKGPVIYLFSTDFQKNQLALPFLGAKCGDSAGGRPLIALGSENRRRERRGVELLSPGEGGVLEQNAFIAGSRTSVFPDPGEIA